MRKTAEDLKAMSPEELSNLAKRLMAKRAPAAEEKIRPVENRPAAIPLSFSQEGLWLLEGLGNRTAYNESLAIRLEGFLDEHLLERSFAEVVQRHEILRTRFVATIDGEGAQVIDPPGEFQIETADLTLLSAEEQQQETRERLRAEEQLPFHLAEGPLFRVALLKLSPRRHVLCLTAHHIVWDLWSLGVLLRELSILYSAFVNGQVSPLPHLEVQYADYALWQREYLAGDVFHKQLEYWRRQLADAPALLELPTDRARPPRPSFRGAYRWFSISKPVSDALGELGRREGATLFMVLLAAFETLLARWSGQTDIVIGCPIAGRKRRPSELLIGFFVNMLAMRGDLSGNPSFRELLARVKQTALEAYRHQDIPFEKLVAELHPERDLSLQPLFQVTFVLQNQALGSIDLPELQMTPMEMEHESAKFDLHMEMFERSDGLTGRVEYASDLFDPATIDRLLHSLQTLLEGIASDAGQNILQLPLLGQADRRQVLQSWNRTSTDYPRHRCIHELFAEHARLSPNATAVMMGSNQLSYRELDARSNQVAHWLRSGGVRTGAFVALCTEPSPEMIIGMLAILKAGAAYLPIDAEYPDARIRYMLQEAKVEIALVQPSLVSRLSTVCSSVTLTPLHMPFFAAQPDTDLVVSCAAHDLAYLIYTSGSTGQPKGVAIPHVGVNRLVRNTNYITFLPADTVVHFSSISFDAATVEIWGALLNGARLVIFPRANTLTPLEFSQHLRAASATVLFLTTALFHQYVSEQPGMFASLRCLMFGGEVTSPEYARKVLAHGAPLSFLHVYGPTEATAFATYHRVENVPPSAAAIPIGTPIANVEAYVVNEVLEPVPVGVAGELLIGGEGLARGYWNHPSLTAERFIPDPFGKPGGRLYRTGDRVAYQADGSVCFLGRIDQQVKIRGFRIEPGEIELQLSRHPQIKDCAVVVVTKGERKQIAAYLVPRAATCDVAMVRAYLALSLPKYMIPSAFVCVERLPLTANGKINREGLPPIAFENQIDRSYVAPRNEREQCLAQVFAAVLKLDRVGVEDNFFEIGGDSIIALQIVASAAQAGMGLNLRSIFEYQTIAQLAQASATAVVDAEQGAVEGAVPLTPIQRWFFDGKPIAPQHFNQSLVFQPARLLQPGLVEQVTQQLLLQHDALRLRFRRRGSGWQQWNDKPAPDTALAFTHIQVETWDAFTQRAEQVQASLNLTAGPLLRIVLFDAGSSQRLLMVANHLVIDGLSWRILLEDFKTAYQQLERGSAVQLPPKTTSFKGWAEKLAAHARQERFAAEVAYWARLPWEKGNPLPPTKTGGANTVASTREVAVSLSPVETSSLLLRVPGVHRTQINEVLLAALLHAFSACTGQEELSLHLEGHGREDLFAGVDVSRTVGWFTSIYPVFLSGGRADLSQVLQQVKQQLRAVPDRGVRYGILRYLAKSKAIAYMPEPAISFNYLGRMESDSSPEALLRSAQESAGPSRDGSARRIHLLEINGVVTGDGLHFVWQYSEALHDRQTVEQVASCFIENLRRLAAQCMDAPVTEIDSWAIAEEAAEQDIVEGEVPLTPIQRMCMSAMGENFRKNVIVTIWQCRQTITYPWLQEALHHLVRHHDALRLHLVPGSGSLTQWNSGSLPSTPWLQHITSDELRQKGLTAEQFAEETGSSIDLVLAPLLRAALIDGEDGQQQLVLALHHLTVDPLSLSILMEDLATAYHQLQRGQPVRLPGKTLSYRRWSQVLTSWADSPASVQEEQFWTSLPWTACLPIPAGEATPAPPDLASLAETVQAELDRTETAALERAQRLSGALFDEILLAALAEVMADLTGSCTVAINLMHHGRVPLRSADDLSRTVGWFSAEIPAVLDIASAANSQATLRLVKQQVRRIPHSGIGFGILRYLKGVDTMAALPAPPIRLNHLGRVGGDSSAALFQSRSEGFAQGSSLDCPMEVRTYILNGSLQVQWLYQKHLLRADTMQTLAHKFLAILRHLSATAPAPGESYVVRRSTSVTQEANTFAPQNT